MLSTGRDDTSQRSMRPEASGTKSSSNRDRYRSQLDTIWTMRPSCRHAVQRCSAGPPFMSIQLYISPQAGHDFIASLPAMPGKHRMRHLRPPLNGGCKVTRQGVSQWVITMVRTPGRRSGQPVARRAMIAGAATGWKRQAITHVPWRRPKTMHLQSPDALRLGSGQSPDLTAHQQNQ